MMYGMIRNQARVLARMGLMIVIWHKNGLELEFMWYVAIVFIIMQVMDVNQEFESRE